MLTFLAVLVLTVVGYLMYQMVAFRMRSHRMNRLRAQRISLLKQRLENGEDLTNADTLEFFENRQTREDAHQLLLAYDLVNAVPPKFNDLTKVAEGQLAIWLEFPTELGAPADELEYMGRVSIGTPDGNTWVLYEAFRFRMNKPHWAGEHGWMIGTVGPFDDESALLSPAKAFSRFKQDSETTPDTEARWVHLHHHSKGPLIIEYQPKLEGTR